MIEQDELTHEKAEQDLAEALDWPQYYASGEGVDVEDFVPAYYKVDGPNGPVSYVNPNSGPYPTTMHDLVMEAQSDSFRWCERDETPWPDFEEQASDGTRD